jgi:hypothetical protein
MPVPHSEEKSSTHLASLPKYFLSHLTAGVIGQIGSLPDCYLRACSTSDSYLVLFFTRACCSLLKVAKIPFHRVVLWKFGMHLLSISKLLLTLQQVLLNGELNLNITQWTKANLDSSDTHQGAL